MVTYELYFYRHAPRSSSTIIHLAYKSDDPDEYPIYNLKYNIEINKAGSCTFTVGVSHPYYDDVEEMNMFVSVIVKYIKNGEIIHKYCPFVGRVIEISEDQTGNREVTCEGALATLNDTFERVGGWTGIIGANEYDTVIDTLHAIRQIFSAHSTWHYVGWGDYPGIRNNNWNPENPGVFNEVGKYTNIENVTYSPDDGINISKYNNDSDSYKDDLSYRSLYDILFNDVIKKSGGFLLPIYDPFTSNNGVTDALCHWTYIGSYRTIGYYSNYSTLVNYPNENLDNLDQFSRRYWLPNFTKFNNIINLSKESSLKTKFNTIIPVGKDNIGIDGYAASSPTYRIISLDDSPYEDFLPITLSFPDISNADDLRTAAQQWADTHSRDSSIPKKYTITGPEPCGVGCGEVLIMLMRDVIIREDPEEDLQDSLILPCLSMEIDVQNPQNNVYVIGPFIDDTYTETTISYR